MILRILIVNLVLILAYMTAWFLLAKSRKRLDTIDVAWGLGSVVAAWSVEAQKASAHSLLIAIITTFWGLRLANHIFQRAKTRSEDPRYEELSRKWKGNFWLKAYTSLFLTQGLLIWVVSLPLVTAAGKQLPGLGWLSALGASLWLVGFVIETLSDRQLSKYLQIKDRPKVLEFGLWRYSRHPNYFGELLQWWAIGIIALQVSYGWFGLLGPLTLSVLIIFVSGIPPIEKRRAKDPAYQAYQKRTSALIPWPPKKSS